MLTQISFDFYTIHYLDGITLLILSLKLVTLIGPAVPPIDKMMRYLSSGFKLRFLAIVLFAMPVSALILLNYSLYGIIDESQSDLLSNVISLFSNGNLDLLNVHSTKMQTEAVLTLFAAVIQWFLFSVLLFGLYGMITASQLMNMNIIRPVDDYEK